MFQYIIDHLKLVINYEVRNYILIHKHINIYHQFYLLFYLFILNLYLNINNLNYIKFL